VSSHPLSDGLFLQDDIYGLRGKWSDIRGFKGTLSRSGRDILPGVCGRTRPPRLSELRLAMAGRNPQRSDHGDAQRNFFRDVVFQEQAITQNDKNI
jgi:hypothetical protein